MRRKITKATVDALRADGDKAAFLWDTELRGFGFKRLPSGAGVFLCQYRHGGRVHRVKLGGYPPLTPDEARRLAKAALGRVATGVNVAAERQAARQAAADAVTLADVAARFLTQYVNAGRVKGSTAVGYALHLRRLPDALARRPAAEIRRADIARFHAELAESAGRFAANRTLSTLSKMFSWAEGVGYLPEGSRNPCRGVERHDEPGRDRRLSDAELARLGAALDAATGNPWALAAIRLLLATGCRKGEILSLKWADIAEDFSTVRLRDTKANRPRTVHLSRQAQTLLATLPRMLNSEYVFPGRQTSKPLSSLQATWRKLTRAAGIEGVRVHDTRHTAASIMAEAGVPLSVAARFLGQSSLRVHQRYQHVAEAAEAEAAAALGEALDKRMGVVVPLRKESA